MTIYNFQKRGRQLREVLSTHSNLNTSRYVRLMLLASMELFANFPLTVYIIWRNATQYEVFPYVSWYNVHVGFSHVNQFPRVFWGGNPELVSGIEMQRWLTVACALVFVSFFGFADEARKHYSKAYTSIASRLGLTTVTESSFADSRYVLLALPFAHACLTLLSASSQRASPSVSPRAVRRSSAIRSCPACLLTSHSATTTSRLSSRRTMRRRTRPRTPNRPSSRRPTACLRRRLHSFRTSFKSPSMPTFAPSPKFLPLTSPYAVRRPSKLSRA